MTEIYTRWAGQCTACGTAIAEGEKAEYYDGSLYCLECGELVKETDNEISDR